MISCRVFDVVAHLRFLDRVKHAGEGLVQLLGRGESHAPARVNVLQSPDQATVDKIRIRTELDDEHPGAGISLSHVFVYGRSQLLES